MSTTEKIDKIADITNKFLDDIYCVVDDDVYNYTTTAKLDKFSENIIDVVVKLQNYINNNN